MFLNSLVMVGKVEQELELLEEAEALLLKGVAFRGGDSLGKATCRTHLAEMPLEIKRLEEAMRYARDAQQEMLRVKASDDTPNVQKGSVGDSGPHSRGNGQ